MATNVKKLNPKKFPVQKETASLAECDVRIAELANYKAEKRGVEAGHEMEDWLEAERELTL